MTDKPEQMRQDGDPVLLDEMAVALTARRFRFDDGADQSFQPSGTTTYRVQNHITLGEWRALADGRFSSFWPPNYEANYALTWIVEGEVVVGLRFEAERSGQRFNGLFGEFL